MLRNRRVSALTDDLPWWRAGGISPGLCVAAYQPRGASSVEGSYTNLANPGLYNLTLGGTAPSWNSLNGWIFVGGNNYLKTGITVTSLNWSVFVKLSNGGATASIMFGSNSAANNRFALFSNYEGANSYYQNGSFLASTGVTSGVMGFSGPVAYYNGGIVGAIPVGDGFSTAELWIGRGNWTPAQAYDWTGYIQAVSLYKETLTRAQVVAVTNAMASL